MDVGLNGKDTKWLNIYSYCQSSLHLISPEAKINDIYYFSALAEHIKPLSVMARHNVFIRALKSTGIKVRLGRFKSKNSYCRLCKKTSKRYEEKETDVAIAVEMMRLCLTNEVDTIVLMTGDTDLAPAVRSVIESCPDKQIWFCFPYRRQNKELEKVAHGHFSMKIKQIRKHQFPAIIEHEGSKDIIKPESW